jgi:hypothetical protein
VNAPRCAERCAHGELRYCDHCATVPRMARWAAGLDGWQLADALEALDREPRYHTHAESKAILIEAARRARPGG